MTGIVGKPKVGYPLIDLIDSIEEFLGWSRPKRAFLAGAGSLGSALLGYERFRQHGIDFVAAFDTDPEKIGQLIHGTKVRALSVVPSLARKMDVQLGVIATPARVGQFVADLMIHSGIRAIWNFAPVHLRVPEHVILQNADLYDSLASLSFKLEKAIPPGAPKRRKRKGSSHGENN
jgi:redox-sensing transcriptional repressor